MYFQVSFMGRILALFLMLASAASCAKPSSLTLPPSLCTEVRQEPVIPDEAGLVAPADEAEREAYRAFLNWTAEVLSWGRENTDRAERAKQHGC